MALDDGTLTARLSVDISQLRTGMKEGVTVVGEGAEDMAQAMSVAKLEAGQLQEAYRKLGPIAAQGNADAVSAIAQHIRANEAAVASVLKLEAAQRSQAEAARAAAAQAAAADVIRGAAAGAGGQDNLQVAQAAAAQQLAAAKARLVEVTQAASVANLDEQTTTQALATVDAEVAAAQQELAAAKAALTERTQIQATAFAEEASAAEAAAVAAGATAEVEALAANSGADTAAVRLAQAYLQKAAAQVEVKRVTDLANASSADEETKAAAIAPALARERTALVELTAAQKAFAASAEAASVASEMESGAAEHSVTSMTAASGAIRVFEGALPVRAVEAFITKVLPLGGILQAAFPIIGAIALFEMITHIQEAIEKLGEKSELAAEKLQRDFRNATAELRNTALQLDATNEKLQESIDKLEKKPGDGLRAGLAEARAEAARLGDELDKDLDKIEDLSKKHNVGFWGGLTEGKGQTGDITTALLNAKKQVDDVRHEYDQMLDTARAGGDTPDHIENIQQHRLAALQKAYDDASKPLNDALGAATNAQADHNSPTSGAFGNVEKYQGGGMQFSSGKDNTEAIGLLRSGLQTFQSEQEIIGGEYRKGHLEITKAILEGSKSVSDAQRKAAEEMLKGFEAERQAEIDAGKIGAQADENFWAGKIRKFTQGSDQYRAVQAKIDADRKELGRSNEQYQGLQDRGAEITAKTAESQALASIQFDVAAGKITKLEGVQRSAAAEATYYAQRLNILRGELSALNAATDVTPEERRNRGAGLQNSITQTEGERDNAAAQAKAKEADAQREAADRAAEAQARLDAAVTQGKEIAAQNTEQMKLASIAADQHDGRITALGAAYQTAAAHATFYKEKLVDLQKELDNLKAKQATLQQGTPAWNDNQAQQQRVQNNMAQVGAAGQTQQFQDKQKIQQDIAQPYLDAYQEITQSFMTMQSQMLTGHKTFAQAMRQEEQSLAMYGIQQIEQWGIKQGQQYVIDLAHYVANLTAKRSADTAAEATQTATAATAAATKAAATVPSNIAQIQSLAAVAAAGAYASEAAVPIVGPGLAAAAAAAAYGEVSAFSGMAAFESGTGYIPREGIAMLHPGEAVVPAPANATMQQVLRAVTNSPSTSTSSTSNSTTRGGHTFHMPVTQNFHGAKANPREISKAMEKRARYAMALGAR